MNRAKLLEVIENDRERHVSLLQRLVQAPSPNPPGNTTQAAQVLVDFLKDHQLHYKTLEVQPSMPNIVSVFQGEKGPGAHVVMNGHTDVFPVADASEWKHDPYSGHVTENMLHGRGVVDMKAGTAATVIAFSYLHKYRADIRGSVALMAVSDEETGGRWGTKWLLNEHEDRHLWRGDCMISAEPTGTNSVRFGEKGTLRLTFTIRAEGAHGAYLHLSEGTNRTSVRLVSELITLETLAADIPCEIRKYLQRHDIKSVADQVMGGGASDSLSRLTVNVGTWNGGVKVNMIPSRTTLELDIRLPIGMQRKEVMSHIEDILTKYDGVEVHVQEAASNASSYSPHDHPLLAAIVRSASFVTGSAPAALPSLGGTDCKHYRYAGIPTYAYGVSPKTMASRDERVDLDEFMTIIKTHTLTVWEYLGGALE